MDKTSKSLTEINDNDLSDVSGGELKLGICEFNMMDAQKCKVGSYAINQLGFWFQCKAADNTHPTNYWYCAGFPNDTSRFLEARPRNSNE